MATRPIAKAETDADSFRVAMSRLAAGVVMVTCHVDGKPWGLTVSACCSVSMEPRLLLVSLGSETASAHAIHINRRFGVSVLGESLIDVARFGSFRGQPKFVHEFCHGADLLSESPVVASALAHVDCTVEQEVPAGDHVIYIGRVRHVVLSQEEHPLVYYGRTYHRLGESTDLHVVPVHEETIDSLLFDYPLPRQFKHAVVPGSGTHPSP